MHAARGRETANRRRRPEARTGPHAPRHVPEQEARGNADGGRTGRSPEPTRDAHRHRTASGTAAEGPRADHAGVPTRRPRRPAEGGRLAQTGGGLSLTRGERDENGGVASLPPGTHTHDVAPGQRGHGGRGRARGQELGAGQGQGQARAVGRLRVSARGLLPVARAPSLFDLHSAVCGRNTQRGQAPPRSADVRGPWDSHGRDRAPKYR